MSGCAHIWRVAIRLNGDAAIVRCICCEMEALHCGS